MRTICGETLYRNSTVAGTVRLFRPACCRKRVVLNVREKLRFYTACRARCDIKFDGPQVKVRRIGEAVIKSQKLVLLSAIAALQIACSDDKAPAVSVDPSEHSTAAPAEPALTLPKRLAFMTGHVEAGLALYRAGELQMAAPHLLHPVSETHAAEREGLDALGFEGALFEAVSEALDSGVPAADVEPQLLAAKKNLTMLAERAGGDPEDAIDFLLDTIVEEYEIGVRDGVVADMGEYQDAFGFTVVAIERASAIDHPQRAQVISALRLLLDSWPAAPIPPENPAPPSTIRDRVAGVRAILPDSR